MAMMLENVYRTNKQKLIFKVYRYTKDYSLSEDIVQTAMVKALCSLSDYDATRGSLKGWLTKIVFSCLWDHFRKEKKKPPTLNLESVNDEDLVTYQDYPFLWEYLLRLRNIKHRHILWDYLVLGYDDKETGGMNSVSPESVRKAVERFRAYTKQHELSRRS